MLKLVIQNFLVCALGGLLLFAAADTLDWPQAWIFLLLFFGCGQAIGYWLLQTNPTFLAERLKSPLRDNRTAHDRTITAVLCLALAIWMVLMALDARRYEWSSTPIWIEAVGAMLIIATFCGWRWVLQENSFAVTSVRLQPERGQTVISSGPYAFVRHPMYAIAAGLFIGAPLMLGSLWGLLGIFVFMPLLARRALSEEAIMREGLRGYGEYAAAVRYRLLPGVW